MKHQLTVRLDQDVQDALVRLAQRENRSLSNMVQTLVKKEALAQGCYVLPKLKSVGTKAT